MDIRPINNAQQKPLTTKQFICRNIVQPTTALAATGSVITIASGINKGHMTHMNILERGLTSNNKYIKNVFQYGAKNIKLGAIGLGASLLTGFVIGKFIDPDFMG